MCVCVSARALKDKQEYNDCLDFDKKYVYYAYGRCEVQIIINLIASWRRSIVIECFDRISHLLCIPEISLFPTSNLQHLVAGEKKRYYYFHRFICELFVWKAILFNRETSVETIFA